MVDTPGPTSCREPAERDCVAGDWGAAFCPRGLAAGFARGSAGLAGSSTLDCSSTLGDSFSRGGFLSLALFCERCLGRLVP